MLEALSGLIVVAADEIPPDSIMGQLTVPLAIVIFLGSVYLLLRSGLGTRRAYLVLATVFFGFMLIMSAFWGFGAPGTPQATGPSHLPGQPLDELQPRWIPFAQDSLLAERPDLSIVKDYPEGFVEEGWPEEFADEADRGVEAIREFFASEDAGEQIEATWEEVEVSYAEAPETGLDVLGIVFQEVDPETLELVPEGETYLAFGYFEPGAPLLPSYLFMGASLVGFAFHAWLLDRDERRQRRREREAQETAESERVPAGT